MTAIHTIVTEADVRPEDVGRVIHGTMLATNALIERKGALTALVTTEGFRDSIEMRTESRYEQYDLNDRLRCPIHSDDGHAALNLMATNVPGIKSPIQKTSLALEATGT